MFSQACTKIFWQYSYEFSRIPVDNAVPIKIALSIYESACRIVFHVTFINTFVQNKTFIYSFQNLLVIAHISMFATAATVSLNSIEHLMSLYWWLSAWFSDKRSADPPLSMNPLLKVSQNRRSVMGERWLTDGGDDGWSGSGSVEDRTMLVEQRNTMEIDMHVWIDMFKTPVV